MKIADKDSIEANKLKRLAKSSKKNLISRNNWGMKSQLSSKPYTVLNSEESSDVMTKEDIMSECVKQAILKIKYIQKSSKDLDILLKKIDPENIITICSELGVDIDLQDILAKKEISEKFKWDIIFGLDRVNK
jgi:hypothetical protein